MICGVSVFDWPQFETCRSTAMNYKFNNRITAVNIRRYCFDKKKSNFLGNIKCWANMGSMWIGTWAPQILALACSAAENTQAREGSIYAWEVPVLCIELAECIGLIIVRWLGLPWSSTGQFHHQLASLASPLPLPTRCWLIVNCLFVEQAMSWTEACKTDKGSGMVGHR